MKISFEFDRPEELQEMIDWFSNWKERCASGEPTISENKKQKKTRSEINHQNYERRKERVNQESLNQTDSDSKEERAVSPLDSPLPFPPTTPIPITPLIPSSQKEETAVTAEAPKATPNDRAYWNFAGANGDMAYAFFKATRIAPVRSEFGKWQNDLRDLAEAGITIQDMQRTVEYMRSQNLRIKSPGSILGVAKDLKANPQKSKIRPQTQSWTEVAEQIAAGDIYAIGDGKVIDL